MRRATGLAVHSSVERVFRRAIARSTSKVALPRRFFCAIAVYTLIVSLASSAPARAQYVEAAIALIQLVRSFQASGSGSSWIKTEFDAINLKIDAVLQNQERLAAGIQSLSQQIADLEKSFATEINAQPFKEVLAKLIENQATINDLARQYQNLAGLSAELRTLGLQDIRRRLDLAKQSLPDVFARLSGVDAAYGKLKMSAISRVGLVHVQIIYNIALMDVLLDRETGSPDDRIIWYVQKYSAIEQGATRFLSEESLESSRETLRRAYYDLETPVDNSIDRCFDPMQERQGRYSPNHLTVRELIRLEFKPGDELSGALTHGEPKRNEQGILVLPVNFVLICGAIAATEPRLIDEFEPCRWYQPQGGGDPVWGCEQKTVKFVKVFQEKLALNEATHESHFDEVPERAIAILTRDSEGEVWTLRYEASPASWSVAEAQLLQVRWGGFVEYRFDKMLSKEDNIEESWVKDCIERRSDCAEKDLGWDEKPSKFLGGVKEFATMSSAKAMEFGDFARAVRELKKLRADAVDEGRRISSAGHL